jgi:ketosteroid isomerase-like protein
VSSGGSSASRLVRRLLEVIAAQDFDAVEHLLDPEVEWTTSGRFLEGGVFRGPAEVRGYVERIAAEFEPFVLELIEIREVGDAPVVHTRTGGHGARSGADVLVDLHTVMRFRGELLYRARNFSAMEEAVAAASTV